MGYLALIAEAGAADKGAVTKVRNTVKYILCLIFIVIHFSYAVTANPYTLSPTLNGHPDVPHGNRALVKVCFLRGALEAAFGAERRGEKGG